MSTRARRVPTYPLHKPSGQARVMINGKHIYLGGFGTPESWEKYNRLISRFARRNEPCAAERDAAGSTPKAVRIDAFAA